MGLFDVFSKGGKYFGKSVEPKCEYCEFGKRAKDGNKVLCSRKGLVDAGFHCPKFIYSPLKRIPVKQMKLVGFLEGDYDEKNFDEEESAEQPKTTATADTKSEASAVEPKKEHTAAKTVKPAADDLAALAAAAEATEYQPDEADAPKEDAEENSAAALSDM